MRLDFVPVPMNLALARKRTLLGLFSCSFLILRIGSMITPRKNYRNTNKILFGRAVRTN